MVLQNIFIEDKISELRKSKEDNKTLKMNAPPLQKMIKAFVISSKVKFITHIINLVRFY